MARQMPPEFYKKFARLFGVALIIIGCVLGYYFIYLPAEAAQNHVAEIRIMEKLIALAVVCVYAGLLLVLFNDRFLVIMRNRHLPEYKTKFYLTAIPFVIIGMVTYYSITTYLESLGYEEVHEPSSENSRQ